MKKRHYFRYVSLNMLMKAIALDSQAVQKHRVTILECVKDPDPSIRKRALELVYLLVNENNVKFLTKELVAAKIYSTVEKCASPDRNELGDRSPSHVEARAENKRDRYSSSPKEASPSQSPPVDDDDNKNNGACSSPRVSLLKFVI